MRFKRLIATALAAAMILGLVSVGFAASFEDTEGFEFEASVLKLANLGIISGYPDGTFKPDNLVTRAEFAKMIVCMLGLESAAKSLKGEAVPFADVDADHWAAGYINVAQMMGIVNGYEDGTFRPQDNITYAEAFKMVLAAMGYSEDGFLVVRWPATWIAKAIELELDKDLTIASGLPITRGEVAKLFDNSLTKKHVVVKDGEFAERDPAVTFMSKLKVNYIEGQVIDSPELWTNTSGKVKIKGKDDEKSFAIEDYDGLLGHNVRVWYKGSKVLGVEVLSTEKLLSKTEYDKIKAADFAKTALFVKNYAVVDEKPAVGTVYDIAVVYDGSTPIAAKVADYTVGRITSIYDYRSIIYVDGDRLDLRGVEVDFRGEADDFEDLKEGDTVHYIYDAQNEKAIIIVLRETFKGRLTEVNTTGSTIKVGGETFSVLGDEARRIAKENVGALVTLYLDQNGKVFAIKVDKEYEKETVTYGIVVATATRLVDGKRTHFVTVLTVDGEEVEYETDKEDFELGESADVVRITEKFDGTIPKVEKIENPKGLPVVKVTAKKLNDTYTYADDTLWLEWIEDDRVWVVRPRPAVGDWVDLYIEGDTIVVGIVSEPEVDNGEDDQDEQEIWVYQGTAHHRDGKYILLGETETSRGVPYLYVGDDKALSELELKKGEKVKITWVEIEGEDCILEIEVDRTAPKIESAKVEKTDNGDLVLTVEAFDKNLYSLEVDHSHGKHGKWWSQAQLPEFTVYADPSNPWGTPEAKAQFDTYGVTVDYDADTQTWTLTFEADGQVMDVINDPELSNGAVEFYLVAHDAFGNSSGDMDGSYVTVVYPPEEGKDG